MKLKLFTFRYAAELDGFDDAPMQAFLADKQVLSVQDHFFIHEQTPTWALLVSYRDIVKPGERPADATADARTDFRAELSEEDRPLYDALRKWRNDRALRDGRPPYILLTNRQMADIARLRGPWTTDSMAPEGPQNLAHGFSRGPLTRHPMTRPSGALLGGHR